jgi:hypothetical protein
MADTNMGMTPAPDYGHAYGQQPGYGASPAGYGMPPSYGMSPAYPAPGYPTPAYAAPGYAAPGYAAPGYPAAPYQMPVAEPDQKAGLAIAGLVMGIISLVASLLPLCGFPLAIGGLVFSILGRKSSRRTMATVGLVLSSIGMALTLLSAAFGAYMATH